jgi:CheY-like chemotaxis protein
MDDAATRPDLCVWLREAAVPLDEDPAQALATPWPDAPALVVVEPGGSIEMGLRARRQGRAVVFSDRLLCANRLAEALALLCVSSDATSVPGPAPAAAPLAPLAPSAPLAPASQARAHGRRVLVAEDNPLGQQVALEQLRLAGYEVDVAADGQQALQMWREHPYGLLLTDLHMPRLDGRELAQAVRREEAASGRARTPIVALTANALDREQARCLELGMDLVLTKPLALPRLRQVMAQYLPAAAEAAPIDEATLRGLVAGNAPLEQRLIGEFIRHSNQQLHALAAALAQDDRPALAAIAHSLLSSARIVGAQALSELCARLEQQAPELPREQVLERVGEVLAQARVAIEALSQRQG